MAIINGTTTAINKAKEINENTILRLDKPGRLYAFSEAKTLGANTFKRGNNNLMAPDIDLGFYVLDEVESCAFNAPPVRINSLYLKSKNIKPRSLHMATINTMALKDVSKLPSEAIHHSIINDECIIDNVSEISEKAFYLSNFSKLRLNKVRYIDDYAFDNCKIDELIIQDVKEISEFAFYGCDIKKVVFQNVNAIPENAFSWLSNTDEKKKGTHIVIENYDNITIQATPFIDAFDTGCGTIEKLSFGGTSKELKQFLDLTKLEVKEIKLLYDKLVDTSNIDLDTLLGCGLSLSKINSLISKEKKEDETIR